MCGTIKVLHTVFYLCRVKRKRVAVGVDPYEYARSIDENRTMFHVIRKVENRSFTVFYAGEKALFLAYIGFVSVGVDAQVDPVGYSKSLFEVVTCFSKKTYIGR